MKKAIWGDSSLFFFLLGWGGISSVWLATEEYYGFLPLPASIQKDAVRATGLFFLLLFLFSFSHYSRGWWQYAGVFFCLTGVMLYLMPENTGNTVPSIFRGTLHWVYLVSFSFLGAWIGTVFRRTDLVWIFCFLFALLDMVFPFFPFPGFSGGDFLGRIAGLKENGDPILLFFIGYFIQITYSLNLSPIRTFFSLILGLAFDLTLAKITAFFPTTLPAFPSVPLPMAFFFLFQWRELKPKREEVWMALGFSVLFLFMLIFGWVMLWLSKRLG
ncbi:MAG: hypothetical protein V2G48_05970 [bacterium JZ-2024 1]